MATDSLPLSVLIPTRRGWGAAEPAVRSFMAEVPPEWGEIVVLDGSGTMPPEGELAENVRWIAHKAGSVFQLRAAGYREVRGDIVAVTEDHCRAVPGWADTVMRAHREHPTAVGIAGAVRNGTPEHRIDWGAFLITQTPFLEPLSSGPLPSVAGPNLSYKRAAIERMEARGDLGVIELLDNPGLLREGEEFRADDRILVLHDRAMGVRGTSVIEFHNGRTVAGFRRTRFGLPELARLLLAPGLTLYRSIRTVRTARRKRVDPAVLRRSVAPVVWLHACYAAGEVLGYLAGPGDSPRRLN
jgi:hypothetical protein